MPAETLRMPVQEPATGSTFAGRYQIIEELGRGGMGKVYKVFDAKIQEKIALKLIKPEVAADPETIERFSNELKLARKVRHENVCGMFDLGEWEGVHFITMEYVSGEDLKSFIRRSRHLTVETAVGIAREICEGLAAAHKLGVIHRDLKPGNIMIDRDGKARIMDFGIARSLKGKGITGAGMMIGTPEYMSPEQAEGKDVDQRSDIYSLGVILFEMLTGRVPFEGETPLGVAIKHKTEPPPDPKKLNPQIPDGLSQLILHCLEKDRAKRYQSADEALADLGKIESGIPTTSREIPKKKPFTSKEINVKFNIKKLFVPLAAISVLVVAAVLVIRLIPKKDGGSTPSGIPSLAILYFKNNTGDPKMDFWRSALAESLITDISQSKYIRVLSWDEIYGTLKDLNLLEAQGYTTDDLKKVAENGQAEYVLQGSLSRAGDKFRIETTLRQIKSGKASVPETARAEGIGEQSIYAMVDELTRTTKESLKLTREQIANDIDYEIGKVTTSSLEAYRYFQQAVELQYQVKHKESYPLLKKAIEIDPEFALAYWGIIQGNAGLSPSETKMYREKALALSSSLPDRERWRIEGSYYWSDKTLKRSVEAYSKLLALYPWDLDAANDLGVLYFRDYEDYEKAIEIYEKLFEFYPVIKSPLFLGNLSAFYCLTGRFEEAERVLEDYLKKVGENGNIHLYLGNAYLHQGKFDAAFAEADKILLLDPSRKQDVFLRGRVFQAQGRWPDAEKEFIKNLSQDDPGLSLQARRYLSILYAGQGQFGKAKDILEESLKPGGELAGLADSAYPDVDSPLRLAYIYLGSRDFDQAERVLDDLISISLKIDNPELQRTAVWLKGLACAGRRSLPDAEKAAGRLARLAEQTQSKRQGTRLYNHLMGCLELEKGNFPRAVEYLEKAKSLLPGRFAGGAAPYTTTHPLFLTPLGEAYLKSGDLDKARAEFEAVSRVIHDRTFCGDLWAESFYWLGQIAEKQGRKADAIANYQRFLDIWKDADPDRPEPADARKRLAALH
jgi:serine/threonine protein kinase/lipoprotein NlpI